MLKDWSNLWQMKFNPKKCYTMRIHRKRHQITHTYTLGVKNCVKFPAMYTWEIKSMNDSAGSRTMKQWRQKQEETLGNARQRSRSYSLQLIQPHAVLESAVTGISQAEPCRSLGEGSERYPLYVWKLQMWSKYVSPTWGWALTSLHSKKKGAKPA